MSFTAEQIASFLQGTILGDKNASVSDVSDIVDGKEGTLCFLCDAKYVPYLKDTKASIVLISENIPFEGTPQTTIVRVVNARAAMAQLLQMVENVQNPLRKGIEQPSFIADNVAVPENAYIGAFAYISKGVKLGNDVQIYPQVFLGENVEIGEGTILYPGVKILHDCKVGAKCILHAGVVIGADGFGFEPNGEGVLIKVPQIGNVVVDDNVELGANTTIDRAMMGSTHVHENVKIDNLVQVGHNVEIGKSTMMCGQAGIAGSTQIGEHCILTGQVGVTGHIKVVDGVVVGAKSGVTGSILKPGQYVGFPAIEAGRFRRSAVLFKNLPDLEKRISQLENKVK